MAPSRSMPIGSDKNEELSLFKRSEILGWKFVQKAPEGVNFDTLCRYVYICTGTSLAGWDSPPSECISDMNQKSHKNLSTFYLLEKTSTCIRQIGGYKPPVIYNTYLYM